MSLLAVIVLTVVAAILYTAPTSKAELGNHARHLKVCSAHQSPKSELRCGKTLLHTHSCKAHWIKHHTSITTGETAANLPITAQWRNRLKFHLWMVRRARGWITEANARLTKQALGTFPPHHALWVCIGNNEGSPTSVNPNGHYGMLQMTYNWLRLIKGRASDYSQAVQEWAAEKGYQANHYSQSFLIDQWLKWDGAYYCLKFA